MEEIEPTAAEPADEDPLTAAQLSRAWSILYSQLKGVRGILSGFVPVCRLVAAALASPLKDGEKESADASLFLRSMAATLSTLVCVSDSVLRTPAEEWAFEAIRTPAALQNSPAANRYKDALRFAHQCAVELAQERGDWCMGGGEIKTLAGMLGNLDPEFVAVPPDVAASAYLMSLDDGVMDGGNDGL